MPRGGRRRGSGKPHVEPCTPPKPPKSIIGVEREAWVEVAAQVVAVGSYTRADYSAFRLAVKALAAVYDADPELKETSLKSLIENASKMLGRFGLDPIARGQLKAPDVEEDEADDDLAEFLEDGESGVQ